MAASTTPSSTTGPRPRSPPNSWPRRFNEPETARDSATTGLHTVREGRILPSRIPPAQGQPRLPGIGFGTSEPRAEVAFAGPSRGRGLEGPPHVPTREHITLPPRQRQGFALARGRGRGYGAGLPSGQS